MGRTNIGTSSRLHPIQRPVPLEVSSKESDDISLDNASLVPDVAADEEPAVVSHRPQRQTRRPLRLDL